MLAARMLPPMAEASELPRLRNSMFSPLAAPISLAGVCALIRDGIAAYPIPVPTPTTVVPTITCRWLVLLVPLVAERLSPWRRRRPDTRPAAIVGSALACLDAAQEAWADNPGTSLSTVLDEAMGALGNA